MHFELTDEQQMVRKTVREFAEERLRPTALERDKEHRPPMDEIREFGELGFYGCTIPEEYGGNPLDPIAECIIIEELSRVDAAFGLFFCISTGIGTLPLAKWGTEKQKRKYLPKLASGEIYAAYALTEPAAGSDAAAIQATAVKKNGSYVLNGQKVFCTNGEVAGLITVMAKTDPAAGSHGISAFLVEPSFPGFIKGKQERKMGMNSSDTAEMFFQNMQVPAEQLLGAEGQGFTIALESLDDSRIDIASQAVGIAQGAFEEAVKFASQREQFGRKIGSFQLIYNTVAEMRTRLEASRLLTYRAAWLRGQEQRHTTEAAIAKYAATENARWICDKALQLHGGYGYTTDFPVERYFREVKVTEIYEGSNEIQKLVIARNSLPREAFS